MAHFSSTIALRVSTLALAALLLPAALAAQQDEPKPRILSVTGEGTASAAPEVARVRVGVVTESKTAREASEENARKMTRVVDALRKAGVPEDKIQTVQLTIDPAYDYGDGRQVLRGFQARNVVEAKTRDLARLGDVLDAIIQVGGNTVEGILFELEDPGAAQARAMADAVDDARQKAEVLAKAARVELGEVQEISAGYGGPIPLPSPRVAVMEARTEAAPPPVSPGELTITSSVQVVYRIK
jgi:hypothetical protein